MARSTSGNGSDVSRHADLEPLAWDSGHFGFPVARIPDPDLEDARLVVALAELRQLGYRLVYWSAGPERTAPEGLLRDFAGRLVDRKATFVIDDLDAVPGQGPAPARPVRIAEYPRGDVSPRLVELALVAGAFSRFRTDPLIPPGKFEALYETWIRRANQGDLADVVLIAASSDHEVDPAGMVTVQVRAGTGTIGLLAVHEADRGRGVGARLIAAAHGRMRALGAKRATVVTQLDNTPACRLYERSGYRLVDVRNCYHFWPLEIGDSRPSVVVACSLPQCSEIGRMPDIDLSVVIPVYRSQETLRPLVRRLLPILEDTGLRHEIVFVEDAGPDDSWAVLAELRAEYPDRIAAIQLMRNFGQHNALMCGFRHARGRFVVTMDDDLQNPPEEIPKLLRVLEEGGFDLVYGSYGAKRHAGWRNLGSTLVNFFYRITFQNSIQVTSFRIIRRELLECIFSYNLNFTFVDGLLAWNTRRIGSVPVDHSSRAAGRSGYNLGKLLSLAFNLFTNFSLLPLQFVSLIGFGAAAFGFVLGIYYLVLYLVHRVAVPGYASTIIAVLVLGGTQLLALGVMGEYLGRLHINVNRKPQYTERQVLKNRAPVEETEAARPGRGVAVAPRVGESRGER